MMAILPNTEVDPMREIVVSYMDRRGRSCHVIFIDTYTVTHPLTGKRTTHRAHLIVKRDDGTAHDMGATTALRILARQRQQKREMGRERASAGADARTRLGRGNGPATSQDGPQSKDGD